MIIWLGLTLVSLLIWLVLLIFWGNFWRCDQNLDPNLDQSTNQDLDLAQGDRSDCSVCVVIPARNEADLLPITLRSLLTQTYKGSFHVVLVDDQSTDGTGEIANEVAKKVAGSQPNLLTVISAQPLAAGWTGKLWAMEQGIDYGQSFNPDYFLLTDADIAHDPDSLNRLVKKAQTQDLDLVSVMVLLRCQSLWEKILIPAFVFFFQKLYPFPWVNNPHKSIAAAAGGCILIKSTALDRIGGIQSVRQALIDDCALAKAVKASGTIWLGLTQLTHSLRPYPSLSSIWDMVARTAYTQLNYSPLLLIGTLIGMPLIYILAPVSLIAGGFLHNWQLAIAGLVTWLVMTICYLPTIRFYKCPIWLSFCLPAIAFLYTLMTLDSARRHWQGKGGAWKGRVYS